MKNYYMANRTDLLRFLGQSERYETALDVGCASGELGRLLVEHQSASMVDGVEVNRDAAELAKKVLRKVWMGTLEEFSQDIPWESYDLVVMADVLEHLLEPWDTLGFLFARCKPGCRLLLSVPNVRHHSVVFPLIFQGRFDYRDSGIMDRTHLHFFTRFSLQESVTRAGWQIRRESPNIKEKYLKWWYPHRVLGEFLAVQHFVLAEK